MRLLPLVALVLLTGCPQNIGSDDKPVDTAADTDTDTDSDTDTDTDSDTDTDTDTDSDADTDADTDADADTDTDTDTDTTPAECSDDLDGDGVTAGDGDCRPDDAEAFPGAPERCNGRDDNCDGKVDEDDPCVAPFAPPPPPEDTGDTAVPDTAVPETDDDGDGYSESEGDCDDTNRRINPRSPETCGNGIDENCDGVDDECDEPDTGVAAFNYMGDFTVCEDEAFLQGHFAYELTGLRDGERLCTAIGEFAVERAAPSGCPDCDWSFDLSGLQNTQASGAYCEQFGLDDDWLAGAVDYSWGFAETYEYVGYYGSYTFENTLMLYIDRTYGWFPFAFNYAGRNWVEGDSYYASFSRPVTNAKGYYAYYYYYR
ncbi:MAG: putative metal-binding motif-containing protein [Pseudomonadota bacterium]|nr:putative metal-binding motif-containing protein [Pseudomonadota bacterium]